MPRIFIIAGEASGDYLASRVIEKLKLQLGDEKLELIGIGGRHLSALGLTSIFPIERMSINGIYDYLRNLGKINRLVEQCAHVAVQEKPDLVLFIDTPEFSVKLARAIRAQLTVPTVKYVAPSVYAWRPGRAKRLRGVYDVILSIFPFEEALFARLNGPKTIYVGHPAIEDVERFQLVPIEERHRAETPSIVMLPGSRPREIRSNLPVLRECAARITQDFPNYEIILALPPNHQDLVEQDIATWQVTPRLIRSDDEKFAAFTRASVAIACSGTVTLELSLFNVPMIVIYKVDFLSEITWRLLASLDKIALPNIISGQSAVPELLQKNCNSTAIMSHLARLLPDGNGQTNPALYRQLKQFAIVKERLSIAGERPSVKTAAQLLSMLKTNSVNDSVNDSVNNLANGPEERKHETAI